MLGSLGWTGCGSFCCFIGIFQFPLAGARAIDAAGGPERRREGRGEGAAAARCSGDDGRRDDGGGRDVRVEHDARRVGLHAVAVPSDDPTMVTVEHWSRLLDGELYAASSRVEWALLLRRTYGVDALRCPTCSGRMRVMATITEPGAVKKILAHLGLPTEPLPRARARDPTGQESFDFDAA